MSWCTIESDPGVFTELLKKIGVNGVQVEELYSLDPETFVHFKEVFGLIFLFKWKPTDSEEPSRETSLDDPSVFFAKQVISNACATQAILSILMNRQEIEIGSELEKLKNFIAEFPPEMKGMSIGNSDVIREAHNSFGRQDPFLAEEGGSGKDDDVYHFISYVPVNGAVYELDGLQEGPIRLESATEENWVRAVVPHIQRRIESYASTEIRFNLMAIVPDVKDALEREKRELESQLDGSGMEVEGVEEKGEVEKRLGDVMSAIRAEEEKRERWRVENIRRRHNYIPFLMNFLKILARKGDLLPLLDLAIAKSSDEDSERKEEKEKEKEKEKGETSEE
eukprot:TRINITY_DN45_c0_g1_i3.p1 TRINITY_DN45_c0_g1~~TRINITY_DN45_c0_g1_i3.p1  ORF type:complete len:337 (+),score=115.29 TRINITY_DN45_c0_g1_i3:196-1206(+)